MNTNCERLLDDALKLPEADRADIAACLFASLETEPSQLLDAAWEEEISRRISAIDNGRGQFVPWEEARKRMLSRVR